MFGVKDKEGFAVGVFRDYRGEASFGRVAAGYCVVAAVLIFQAPFFLPQMASYCASVGGSLLLTAGSFYLTSKGEQTLSTVAEKRLTDNISKLKALLGIKDDAAADPTATTETPAAQETK